MWLFRSDLPCSSESAEIWHADSFSVKKCPCNFFSTSGEIRLQTHSWKSTPPPPTNSVKDTRTVFWLSSIEILRCLETDEERRGVEFDAISFVFFCILEKKTHGHAKFQPIMSNLENRYEIVTWGRLARSHSILVNLEDWGMFFTHEIRFMNDDGSNEYDFLSQTLPHII